MYAAFSTGGTYVVEISGDGGIVVSPGSGAPLARPERHVARQLIPEESDVMYRLPDGRKPIKKWLHTLIAILVLLLFYSILYANIPASANSEQIFIEHVVLPGETLWSIAKTYHPDADPREIVWGIQKASGITPVIRPGQAIWVPMEVE